MGKKYETKLGQRTRGKTHLCGRALYGTMVFVRMPILIQVPCVIVRFRGSPPEIRFFRPSSFVYTSPTQPSFFTSTYNPATIKSPSSKYSKAVSASNFESHTLDSLTTCRPHGLPGS